jgi:similar to spore coat protein
LHPYHLSEQFQLDLKSSKTTVQIAEMQLFPEDTARLGLFATPDK